MKQFNAIKAQARHNIHVHVHVLYCMSWNEVSKSNLLWYFVNSASRTIYNRYKMLIERYVFL